MRRSVDEPPSFRDYWSAVAPDDHEIHPSHTLALFRGLPDSQLAVMPGTDHGGLDVRIVIDFLTTVREEALR